MPRTETGAYQVLYRDSLGKQRSRIFDRIVDARTFRADVRVRKQRGDLVDPSVGRMKFSEWADVYLEQKIALRERTRDKYESALRAHLLPAFAGASLGSITRADVQRWVVKLNREGYAPETIRGLYNVFAGMLRLAEDEGAIRKTPCRRIELPAPTKEQRYLGADEIELLAGAVDLRYRTLVYTAAYLGLRWQEIAGLKHRYVNLDIEPGTVRVVSTIERARGRYRVVDLGKTKAARRTLKVPAFLREMLQWHLEEYGRSLWTFASPRGGFLRYDNFRTRVWDPAVMATGLAPLTFHELRHTAAALMIHEGGDPLQVKRRMGHEDIRTTLNTYGHLFPDREDDLVAALDRRRAAAVW